jgi:hypothetical protein
MQIHTSNAGNGEWLGTKDGGDEGSHERGEEHFRYTVLLGCFNQVQAKCNSREDTKRNARSVFRDSSRRGGILGEENKGSCWYDTIIPSVSPVAEIPGSSGTNVRDDSTAPARVESLGLGSGGGGGGAGVQDWDSMVL